MTNERTRCWVSDQVAEENIWTRHGGSDRKFEKTSNEELHNLNSSRNIITVFKSRSIRSLENVVRITSDMPIKFWSEDMKGKYFFED
jgi:hypothetical protein